MRIQFPRHLIAFLALVAPACARPVAPLIAPARSSVALTGGPGTSMVYLARTSTGVIVIDLGWWGSASVDRALVQLGADKNTVTDVFLTHSHHDHVASWRRFRASRFHVASGELGLLTGERAHGGWLPRNAERLLPSTLPREGELDLRGFGADTTFAFGSDTVRAYVVAGHTAGSAAYLFRGVLFAGDAITWSYLRGFGPAKRIYTADRTQAIRSLDSLLARLPAGSVQVVCTAHARCTAFDAAFLADVRR